MGNIMYISFSFKNKGWVRWFWVYKFVTFYILMIMVTIFATLNFDEPYVPHPSDREAITLKTKSGLGMLIYAWITSCIWPYVLFACVINAKMIEEDVFNILSTRRAWEGGSTSRDVIPYMYSQQCTEVAQLLKFGYTVPDDHTDADVEPYISIA